MEDVIVQHAIKSIYIAVTLSAPAVATATVIGLCVSIFQTLTQIQEQTLPFLFKMIGTMGTIYLMSPWISTVFIRFFHSVFETM